MGSAVRAGQQYRHKRRLARSQIKIRIRDNERWLVQGGCGVRKQDVPSRCETADLVLIYDASVVTDWQNGKRQPREVSLRYDEQPLLPIEMRNKGAEQACRATRSRLRLTLGADQVLFAFFRHKYHEDFYGRLPEIFAVVPTVHRFHESGSGGGIFAR